jgi:hypothetical protein
VDDILMTDKTKASWVNDLYIRQGDTIFYVTSGSMVWVPALPYSELNRDGNPPNWVYTGNESILADYNNDRKADPTTWAGYLLDNPPSWIEAIVDYDLAPERMPPDDVIDGIFLRKCDCGGTLEIHHAGHNYWSTDTGIHTHEGSVNLIDILENSVPYIGQNEFGVWGVFWPHTESTWNNDQLEFWYYIQNIIHYNTYGNPNDPFDDGYDWGGVGNPPWAGSYIPPWTETVTISQQIPCPRWKSCQICCQDFFGNYGVYNTGTAGGPPDYDWWDDYLDWTGWDSDGSGPGQGSGGFGGGRLEYYIPNSDIPYPDRPLIPLIVKGLISHEEGVPVWDTRERALEYGSIIGLRGATSRSYGDPNIGNWNGIGWVAGKDFERAKAPINAIEDLNPYALIVSSSLLHFVNSAEVKNTYKEIPLPHIPTDIVNNSITYSQTFEGGGGSWYTGEGFEARDIIDLTTDLDLNFDVTSLIDKFISNKPYPDGIPNNGFIIKRENDAINIDSYQSTLKYFGLDTHTIFSPTLAIKWDDSVYTPPKTTYTSILESFSCPNFLTRVLPLSKDLSSDLICSNIVLDLRVILIQILVII